MHLSFWSGFPMFDSPEPVLVKCSFLAVWNGIKWRKRYAFFAHRFGVSIEEAADVLAAGGAVARVTRAVYL